MHAQNNNHAAPVGREFGSRAREEEQLIQLLSLKQKQFRSGISNRCISVVAADQVRSRLKQPTKLSTKESCST